MHIKNPVNTKDSLKIDSKVPLFLQFHTLDEIIILAYIWISCTTVNKFCY